MSLLLFLYVFVLFISRPESDEVCPAPTLAVRSDLVPPAPSLDLGIPPSVIDFSLTDESPASPPLSTWHIPDIPPPHPLLLAELGEWTGQF